MTNRRTFMRGAGALATLPLIRTARAAYDEITPKEAWQRAADFVRYIKAPTFPDRVFDITKYGAVADGATLNTAAIAKAIAECAASGGGRVLVPKGRFLTGAVHLQSNVELHVDEGATLLFDPDPSNYPIVFTRWEGIELMNYSPLIYARRQKNIAITGKGTLDGQGSARNWWSWKGKWGGTTEYGWKEGMPTQIPARNKLFQMAEDWVPVEKRVFGDGAYLRPPFIQPYECENVLIEGVRVRNSPFWNIHPVMCRNVTLRGVDVYGHGPNNDGCDPESVNGMLIENCTFDTGDDCIAVNSGRNADGRRLSIPSQNILVRNCRMKEGHGGVVVGSQISGGARWVYAENCHMDSPDLWYAIRFKNNALRGGLLENFYYRDIDVGQVGRAAITCDFNYEEGAEGAFTPRLRNIVVERLRVKNAVRVLDSQGLPKAPVEDITLKDCSFGGVSQPSIVKYTRGVKLERVTVNGVQTHEI
ncbi:MAG TPA: glycoside hydrolase family 28 protein [Steroidobacteraceae bacterium]|nr:glycoside hydrolase family 28 protein [Steroidobacteraceae bacterium]